MTSKAEGIIGALILFGILFLFGAVKVMLGGGRRADEEAQEHVHDALESLRAWRNEPEPAPPSAAPEPSGAIESDPQWPNDELDALKGLRAWRNEPPAKDGA